jgi:hypothetical protein
METAAAAAMKAMPARGETTMAKLFDLAAKVFRSNVGFKLLYSSLFFFVMI